MSRWNQKKPPFLSRQQDIRDDKIAGIGGSFIPEIVDVSLIDEVVAAKSHDAFRMAIRLSRERALFVGISSGVDVFASIETLDETRVRYALRDGLKFNL